MQPEKHISKIDLTRDVTSIFQAISTGETVIVESQGQPSAAIVDLIDLQILRAAIAYFIHRPHLDPETSLGEAKLKELQGQPLFDLALCHYLAGAISLARAAEVLGTSWVELRSRLARLGFPVWAAPESADDIYQDALIAESVNR